MALEVKDLSKVGFQDYFRLRRQLQATGDFNSWLFSCKKESVSQ